jgi:ArsR family transcriptional regulator
MKRNDDRVYRMKAEIIKAIAHPIRLAVLDSVQAGEKCVCDIAEEVGAERSNVSRHLSVLVKAGVLSCRKDGLNVFYKLRCACVLDVLECATRVLKQNVDEEVRILAKV